jgi:hypothetical protein
MVMNGAINVPIEQNLPCEENWGDHKLLSIEEDSTSALSGLSDAWKYANSLWTLPQYQPQLLVSSKMSPQAKVLFFAACALGPTFGKPGEVPPFMEMWDIHDLSIDGIQETRQRSMVIPTTPVALLATAASEWNSILQNLLKGQNICTAVIKASGQNTCTPASSAQGSWKVLGNPNVTIGSPNSGAK